MAILTINISPTRIQYARLNKGKQSDQGTYATPDNKEIFYHHLTAVVEQFRENSDICGVTITSAKVTESPTLPAYLQDLELRTALEKRFHLPVSIENTSTALEIQE